MKFQTTDYFTPTRDLNADDVIFSFKRQRKDNKWNGDAYLPDLTCDYYAAWTCRNTSPRWRRSTT